MRYTRIIPVRRMTRPPSVYKISGVVYAIDGVTPQSGATVYCIEEETDTVIGKQTTNGSGQYSFASGYPIRAGRTYHVTAQYDSGAQKYNSESQPYVSPAEN